MRAVSRMRPWNSVTRGGANSDEKLEQMEGALASAGPRWKARHADRGNTATAAQGALPNIDVIEQKRRGGCLPLSTRGHWQQIHSIRSNGTLIFISREAFALG